MDSQDPILGFFVRWVEEFAKHCESIVVICLREGEHHLPANVRVLSLGKESGASRIKYITRFYAYIWRERKNYDAVFVHMNQVYVLLGGLLWRAWGKRIALWYVHGSVTMSLCFATQLVHAVFTTSPESFRIKTRKRNCIGHGIDMEQFAIQTRKSDETLRIITTGRVSATKRIAEMIATVDELNIRGIKAELTIIGSPATEADRVYAQQLQKESGAYIHFAGPIAHAQMPSLLAQHDVFLNLSKTGSVDKAVLEALATGMPAVSSNPAFENMLRPYGLFTSDDSISALADTLYRANSVQGLTEEVRARHSLGGLIPRMLQELHNTKN